MVQHYFSSDTPDLPRTWHDIEICGRNYRILSQGGVFSPTQLDKGTAVLLRKFPFPPLPVAARIVDLGCGWGPISLALAAHYPENKITAVDVNPVARELTKINAENAAFSLEVLEEESARQLFQKQETSIDLLLSNPPIRIGKTALHKLLSDWLALLSPHGQAFLVVQKNLGADSLAVWLRGGGYTVEKIGSAKGYRVFQVGKESLPAE